MSGRGKRPIQSTKHCCQNIGTIASASAVTDIVAITAVADEVTDATNVAVDRASNVQVGSKIFSFFYEVSAHFSGATTQLFGEWAILVLKPNQVLSIEADKTNGLAKDLIGRFSGQVLRTGQFSTTVEQGRTFSGRQKIPRAYQRMAANGMGIYFVIMNHGGATMSTMRKFIYKEYQ